MEYNKTKHAFINITFTVITLIVNLFGAALILAAVKFNESNGTGLLNLATLPPWLYILLGLILMDLIGAWLIHWIQHKVKWLWKFHIIHHTDPNVDVTSGLRHHPGENIFRLLFTSLAVVVSGASFGLVMMYQTISAFFAHFSHANIQMPLAIDKAFSYIFVTPNFHKVHHHYIQPHTDSNYGNIFSIWDHLLRTTTSVNKMDEITKPSTGLQLRRDRWKALKKLRRFAGSASHLFFNYDDISDREIESQIDETLGVSSLIVKLGGVATYPAIVPINPDMEQVLIAAAHEWLHAYLIFQPLGRGYFKGGDMVIINESLADMFGRELGARVYSNLLGVPFEEPERPVFFEPTEEKLMGFDFNNHLRETRLEVELLLSDGLVLEAENYMEKRKNEINQT